MNIRHLIFIHNSGYSSSLTKQTNWQWRFSFWLKSCLDEEKLKLVRISLTKCFAERISIMLLPSEIFKIMFLLIYSVWMIRSLQVSMLSGKEMWKTTESYLMILSWKLTITSLAALVSQPSFAIIKIKKSALVSSFGGGLVVSDALLYFKLWWEMTEERQTNWHIKM